MYQFDERIVILDVLHNLLIEVTQQPQFWQQNVLYEYWVLLAKKG